MQCNKLDANKTHKLFVEELLLLTKATYDPATGEMDTGLVNGLLRELNLTAVPLPESEVAQKPASLTERMLEISSATGELSVHALQINAINCPERTEQIKCSVFI